MQRNKILHYIFDFINADKKQDCSSGYCDKRPDWRATEEPAKCIYTTIDINIIIHNELTHM